MAKFKVTGLSGASGEGDQFGRRRDHDNGDDGSGGRRSGLPFNLAAFIAGMILLALFVYGCYFWFVRRVVVGNGQVLVLLKKDGSRSLPGNQIVVPKPPGQTDQAAYAQWEREYGDCNGILEQVYSEGTYFSFSPFDYEREVVSAVIIDSGKVGVVIKKFGADLDPGQVLADPSRNQRGPLPDVLKPGRHNDYSNPYAYEVKQVEPVQVSAGHRGVVTVMASTAAPTQQHGNNYLVEDSMLGVQRGTEVEGFRQINPFERRITPISITSQRYQMGGDDSIRFPSSDSFEITMVGFVEWSIVPDKLPLLYVQYGEGAGLIEYIEQRIILPYARSFCRLVGSQYNARDFISGETRLKFQDEFAAKLREACAKQGIEVLQALVRDIVPPQAIKDPINEREIAREQILQLEQQIVFAKTEADRVTQQEIGKQNQAIGDANKQVVTIVKEAQRGKDVALTKARQDLAVAKLKLEAARKQAEAIVARGQAEAHVILLDKQAEAEPLRRQIQAFGDGDTYAQFFFFQKIAPAVKSILTNTDGPFADLFKQFVRQQPDQQKPEGSSNVSGVQP
jgi:regulator of protease activity HflC (stomatin/prohibitin superfamily)